MTKMKKSGFIAMHRAVGRKMWGAFAASMVLPVVWMIVSVVLFQKYPEVFGYHPGEPLDATQFCLRLFGPLLVLAVIGGGYILFADWKTGKECCCPHCRRSLAGRNGLTVVASGNCPLCGNKIIDDDNPDRGAEKVPR